MTAPAPAEPLGESRRAGFLTGLALVLPISLAVMAVVALAPILPTLLREFRDVPNAAYWVPMMLTVTALCVAVFSWLAGWLGDRLGRRRILIGALVAYGISGIAPAFLDGFWTIFATRIGVGICEAVIMVLTTAMIADVFTGPSRDRWLAAQTAVASLSALIFFAVGGFLGEFGWRAVFLIYASSFVMLAGILAFTWEPTPQRHEAARVEAAFPWAVTAGICAVTLLASIMFFVVSIQASVGLAQLGIRDPGRIGLLTALASLAVPVGTIIFRFASRMPVAVLLAIEFAILGAGMAGMGLATDPASFVVAAAVNQVGAGMVLPTLLTWAIRQFPDHARGRGTGIWQGAFQIGQFLSPIVVTGLASRLDGLFAAFTGLGVVCLTAAILALAAWATRSRAASAA